MALKTTNKNRKKAPEVTPEPTEDLETWVSDDSIPYYRPTPQHLKWISWAVGIAILLLVLI